MCGGGRACCKSEGQRFSRGRRPLTFTFTHWRSALEVWRLLDTIGVGWHDGAVVVGLNPRPGSFLCWCSPRVCLGSLAPLAVQKYALEENWEPESGWNGCVSFNVAPWYIGPPFQYDSWDCNPLPPNRPRPWVQENQEAEMNEWIGGMIHELSSSRCSLLSLSVNDFHTVLLTCTWPPVEGVDLALHIRLHQPAGVGRCRVRTSEEGRVKNGAAALMSAAARWLIVVDLRRVCAHANRLWSWRGGGGALKVIWIFIAAFRSR